MNRVLAFVDQSPSRSSVMAVGESLAALLEAQLVLVSITDGAEPARQMLAELDEPGVVFGVLGTKSVESKPGLAGHVALELLSHSRIPLALVPPGTRPLPASEPRILVPMDASRETDSAIGEVVRSLGSAGVAFVILHVFDSQTVPPFLDSPMDIQVLAEEFIKRHIPDQSATCHLRIGNAAQQVSEFIQVEDIDAVLIAWHQDLSPGRSEVVRRLLIEAAVTLLVVPVFAAPTAAA